MNNHNGLNYLDISFALYTFHGSANAHKRPLLYIQYRTLSNFWSYGKQRCRAATVFACNRIPHGVFGMQWFCNVRKMVSRVEYLYFENNLLIQQCMEFLLKGFSYQLRKFIIAKVKPLQLCQFVHWPAKEKYSMRILSSDAILLQIHYSNNGCMALLLHHGLCHPHLASAWTFYRC